MTKKIKLNEKQILALPLPEKEITVYDSEVNRLGLRCWSSGKKVWVYTYRYQGKLKKVTIGTWPEVTVMVARETAINYYHKLAKGIDPAENKKSAFPTFAEFSRDYLAWAKQHKKTWKEDERRIRNRLIPAFGNKPLNWVTEGDAEKVIKQVGVTEGHPYEANRIHALIHKMYSWADQKYKLEFKNPVKYIEKFKEKPRDKRLYPEDMPILAEALEQESVHVRCAFLLLLLTGKRMMEILSRRIDEFRIEQKGNRLTGTMKIPDTKRGTPETVRLSHQACLVVQELLAVTEDDNPYIFPGKVPGKHLYDFPRRPLNRIRKKTGLDFCIHTLRHTVGSFLIDSNTSLRLVGAVLNQSTQSITEGYTHTHDDPIHEIMNDYGDKVIDLFEGRRDKEAH